MDYCLGIDIGSITAKAVILEANSNKILSWDILPSGFDTKMTANSLVEKILNKTDLSMDDIGYSVSTGYSRKNVDFSSQQITEISCQAKGIHHLFPSAKTIIDIGGQDSKAIKVDDNGQLVDFEMNDKCSAGTGRFLEVMARSLEIPLEMMAEHSADNYVSISSTCTVFAESEVVSRIAQGADRNAIVGGIHHSIAAKVKALVERIGIELDVIITGGVAKNDAVVKALAEQINCVPLIPKEPQITGALGAALYASSKIRNSA